MSAHLPALLTGALLILTTALFFVVARWRRLSQRSTEQRWQFWEALFLLAIVALMTLGLFINGLLRGGEAYAGSAAFVVRALLVQSALMAGLTMLWLRLTRGLSPGALGLTWTNWRRELGTGAIGGVLIILGAQAAQMGTLVGLSRWFGASPEDLLAHHAGNTVLVQTMLAGAQPLRILGVLLIVSCLIPVTEEIFFRGFAYPALRDCYGISWGIVLNGIFFSALHFSPINCVALALVGMGLGWLYERRGSLIAPIVAHGLNNLVLTLLLIVQSRL